ncbi:K02A2.6-like [Cordylochernes scorpioides]|uniref:K02A2.6-like n=1 Tax=Cordylochernes scorpioides TaxID=51811 RepID=A0ABY6LD40_9ARAC|nr:K02A2.6-like [Cordylochernes scorpioides]
MSAAFLQDVCPLAFVSVAFTGAQVNHSQIEKELSGIYFGCKMFEYLLLGSSVIIQDDIHSLLLLIKKPLCDISLRLQMLILNDTKLKENFETYFLEVWIIRANITDENFQFFRMKQRENTP